MVEPSPETLLKAFKLLERVPLIDGHNDWACAIRREHLNKLDTSFYNTLALPRHTDIHRLRAGQIGGVFWSVYVDCADLNRPELANDFSDQAHYEAMRETMQQIDIVHRLIERYPEHLELVEKADDILRIHKSGKVASLLGAEGLHQIGNSASVLRLYRRLGVRYCTLTHNSHNLYADSHAKNKIHGGLSEAGKKMILEMNRIGMMIDLSHVSVDVMRDALELTKTPLIFSHSSCRGVFDHTRNPPDHILTQLKANNGVLMVTFVPYFTHTDVETASVEHVVDHILHAAEVMSFDHIGIGSDYDGVPTLVKGLEDVSKFPNLVAHMLDRGIAEADVEKVMGLNVIRVLKACEEYAATSTLETLEDELVEKLVSQ